LPKLLVEGPPAPPIHQQTFKQKYLSLDNQMHRRPLRCQRYDSKGRRTRYETDRIRRSDMTGVIMKTIQENEVKT
jgi:hypothetical protein